MVECLNTYLVTFSEKQKEIYMYIHHNDIQVALFSDIYCAFQMFLWEGKSIWFYNFEYI